MPSWGARSPRRMPSPACLATLSLSLQREDWEPGGNRALASPAASGRLSGLRTGFQKGRDAGWGLQALPRRGPEGFGGLARLRAPPRDTPGSSRSLAERGTRAPEPRMCTQAAAGGLEPSLSAFPQHVTRFPPL